jgi:hypothetical protein
VSRLDRDSALQMAREQFEIPLWFLAAELEKTLTGFASVPFVNADDQRALGSLLNCALPRAADSAKIQTAGLQIVYCKEGQSNKVVGKTVVEGKLIDVNIEFHLSGPRGGTAKVAHQFAGFDIEREPTLFGTEIAATSALLLFAACHLNPTGMSIERLYLKFADNVDHRMIEIHRPKPYESIDIVDIGSPIGLVGTKLKLKKLNGDEVENGGQADKWGDAAPSS